MKKLMLIALIALILLACVPAQAQTITMAAPGAAEKDVLVYYGNGTLQGMWNTTSVITLDGTQDYIFTVKPQTTDLIEDPVTWLTDYAFPWVKTNIVGLVILCFLAWMVFGRR